MNGRFFPGGWGVDRYCRHGSLRLAKHTLDPRLPLLSPCLEGNGIISKSCLAARDKSDKYKIININFVQNFPRFSVSSIRFFKCCKKNTSVIVARVEAIDLIISPRSWGNCYHFLKVCVKSSHLSRVRGAGVGGVGFPLTALCIADSSSLGIAQFPLTITTMYSRNTHHPSFSRYSLQICNFHS